MELQEHKITWIQWARCTALEHGRRT